MQLEESSAVSLPQGIASGLESAEGVGDEKEKRYFVVFDCRVGRCCHKQMPATPQACLKRCCFH